MAVKRYLSVKIEVKINVALCMVAAGYLILVFI
jgi:hypothetical protein